jgi:GNAT superfamily N-acetyltransferase
MTALLIRNALPADAEAMARVQVEGWNHAYRSFIPDRLPASYSLETRRGEWRQRLEAPAPGTVHLVAVEADGGEGRQVLGIASGGPPLRDEMIVAGNTDAYAAQVYGLYVDPAHHGGGIGRRLLGNLAARLAALGHRNLCLWAFERNPFRRFYDKLGGATVARAEWKVGGVSVQERAYGWPDIRTLIEACSLRENTE